MKLICWWLGTDALTLVKMPPSNFIWKVKLVLYRIKWWIIKDTFEHWSVHNNLNVHLEKFGIKAKIVVDPPVFPDRVNHEVHEGFNVLYYRPKPVNLGGQKYIDWYYGYDIYIRLVDYFRNFSDINFIEANGKENMYNVYPYIDCYIRPNHWDGMPRMVLECKINGIPYLWCDQIKDGYLNPNFEDFKTFILNEYESWKMRKRNAFLQRHEII